MEKFQEKIEQLGHFIKTRGLVIAIAAFFVVLCVNRIKMVNPVAFIQNREAAEVELQKKDEAVKKDCDDFKNGVITIIVCVIIGSFFSEVPTVVYMD